MLKIMFSAGEASGDLHGASVAKALKNIEPDSPDVWHGRPPHGGSRRGDCV